jgi:hypothetical protein
LSDLDLYPNSQLQVILRRQIDRLKRTPVPLQVIEDTEKLLDLLPEDLSVTTGKNSHPVLLVIPTTLISFEEQLSVVEYRHPGSMITRSAYSYLKLDPDGVRSISDRPHVLLDVENGAATKDLSPIRARVRLTRESRYAFGVEACLALAFHFPETFFQHNIHASDSYLRVGHEKFTPNFFVYAKKIKMKRDGQNDEDANYGTPSYRDVVKL